jgi:hypothetical protein
MKAGSARHRVGDTVYDLNFGECSACGQVGAENLTLDDHIIAVSVAARKAFQHLKAGGTEPDLPEKPEPAPQESPTPIQDHHPEPAVDSGEGETMGIDAKLGEQLDAAARTSEFQPYKLFLVQGQPPLQVLCIKPPRDRIFRPALLWGW